MRILIINGPNLNLLGKREPSVYGETSFDSYLDGLRNAYSSISIDYFQSNIEGEIIDKLHFAEKNYDAVVMNAGAYTHTSVAIADAVAAVSVPVIEVHISNTYSREDFRHRSYLAPHAKGVIIGFGLDSYRLAIESLVLQS